MQEPTKFSMDKDINGSNSFGISFSNINYNTTLSANTEQTLLVPSNNENWEVVFYIEPGSNVFIANNDTAAVPGGSFSLTNTQGNPTVRSVKAGDVLSFITPDTAAYVGVSLYAKP